MKTLLGHVALATATIFAATPPCVLAQSSAVRTPTRDVGRLSLLPGPTLLSPARGAPQKSDSITIMPAAALNARGDGTFRTALPIATLSANGRVGTLSLSSERPERIQPPKNSKLRPRPSPESLRFDAKLTAPATPLQPRAPASPAGNEQRRPE